MTNAAISMASRPEFENHLDKNDPKWFAVYTRYKREKIVLRDLQRKGIEVYLPLQKVVKRYVRKIKSYETPLISCYIFVKIVKDEYVRVLQTQDVVQFVRFKKNLISIPEREIDIVKRVIGEELNMELGEVNFEEGDRVEIIGGKLTGIHGQLVERRNGKKVLIALENIGYSLLIEVEESLLNKL